MKKPRLSSLFYLSLLKPTHLNVFSHIYVCVVCMHVCVHSHVCGCTCAYVPIYVEAQVDVQSLP